MPLWLSCRRGALYSPRHGFRLIRCPTNHHAAQRWFQACAIDHEQNQNIPDKHLAASLYGKRLSETDIRLLHLLPSKEQDDPIEAHLARHSLESIPPYSALSYTWGNPLPLRFPGDDETQLSYRQTTKYRSVRINKRSFPVSRNLHEGLARIRAMHKLPALWVDAICINQTDDEERSHQVRNMGDIYRGANEVLVWLGENEIQHSIQDAWKLIEKTVSSFKSAYGAGFDSHFREITEKALSTSDSVDQNQFWSWLNERKVRDWVITRMSQLGR